MRNLLDWVLKYKTKGTNVILKNGKYYLYKVHSERRKDKNYPVLVTDEYLGVITENGLLKKKENIKKVIVKEFGLSNYYFNKLNNLNIDINKHISLTILFTYKELTLEAFNYSYLSIDYPNFIIDNDVYELYENNKDIILDNTLSNKLKNQYKVCINNTWYEI